MARKRRYYGDKKLVGESAEGYALRMAKRAEIREARERAEIVIREGREYKLVKLADKYG